MNTREAPLLSQQKLTQPHLRPRFSCVGRIHSLTINNGFATWKLQEPRNGKPFDVKLKTTSPDVLEKLATITDGALVGVIASLNRSSAPGEPYTVTRLEVLSRPAERVE
jgi:hypothetical protein